MAAKPKRAGAAKRRQVKSGAGSTKQKRVAAKPSRKAHAELLQDDPISAATRVMGWSAVASDPKIARRKEKVMRQQDMMSGLWNVAGNGAPSQIANVVAQTNMEVAALMGRRSRACLDYPAHISKCQTPQQLLDENARFFQEMMHDYQATNDRLLKAWFQQVPPASEDR